MSNKKTGVLFFVFFLLSFSFISFNYEHESFEDRNTKLALVEDFVRNQVSKEQIETIHPIRWKKPLLYSIEFYEDNEAVKKREILVKRLLIDLSRVTGQPVKKVESKKANLKFVFAPDWRRTLLKHYPEIKNLRKLTLDMNDEKYKRFWMDKKQNNYIFRYFKPDSYELVSSTVFFNNHLERENCQISVNVARIFILSPEKEFVYTNTCVKDELPIFEEAFLKIYYSEKYNKFLEQHSDVNYEQTIDFFVQEMMNSFDKSITFKQR